MSSQIISFKSGRQYQSISCIEKLDNLSAMKDFDYEYSINLQTGAKLSNTVNIFVTAEQLKTYIVDPLRILKQRKDVKNPEPVEVLIKNVIGPGGFPYYSLHSLLPDGYLRDCARNGCTEYFKIKYSLEDKRFLKIKTEVSYRTFLLKRRPRVIQPKTLTLSLEEVDEFVLLLEASLI